MSLDVIGPFVLMTVVVVFFGYYAWKGGKQDATDALAAKQARQSADNPPPSEVDEQPGAGDGINPHAAHGEAMETNAESSPARHDDEK